MVTRYDGSIRQNLHAAYHNQCMGLSLLEPWEKLMSCACFLLLSLTLSLSLSPSHIRVVVHRDILLLAAPTYNHERVEVYTAATLSPARTPDVLFLWARDQGCRRGDSGRFKTGWSQPNGRALMCLTAITLYSMWVPGEVYISRVGYN